jgi:hypothetical protein
MQAIRNDIANLCTTQFPRLTPAEQQVYHGLSQDMSVKSKIGTGVAKCPSGDFASHLSRLLLAGIPV